MFFVNMTSFWKYFLLFPQRSRVIEGIQAVLGFPELKILKPYNTMWLLHERCVKATCKELLPLLQTLSQLYESSGDAEAYIIIPFGYC